MADLEADRREPFKWHAIDLRRAKCTRPKATMPTPTHIRSEPVPSVFKIRVGLYVLVVMDALCAPPKRVTNELMRQLGLIRGLSLGTVHQQVQNEVSAMLT